MTTINAIASAAITTVEAAESATAIPQLFQMIKAANEMHLNNAVLQGRNVISLQGLANFVDPARPITDHFTFIKPLGQGAFGRVGLWTNGAGQQFAIKELVRGSVNEFNVGLSLDHPNVLKVHNYVTKATPEGLRHYLVMEYIDGTTFSHWYTNQKLGLADRFKILGQAADGFQHMLERRVIPSDLHMENIMVSKEGVWKFVDFGHYKIAKPDAPDWRMRKEIGSFLGSMINWASGGLATHATF